MVVHVYTLRRKIKFVNKRSKNRYVSNLYHVNITVRDTSLQCMGVNYAPMIVFA